MKHNKSVIEPIDQDIPKQVNPEKTPDRSNLADLYPKAAERDGYLKRIDTENDYVPLFSIKTLSLCALVLPIPYMVLIFAIDYLIKNTNGGNVFVVLPLVVLGLLGSVAFIYFSTKYVMNQLLRLHFNVSAYLTLYVLCVAPLSGALFNISQTMAHSAVILSGGLSCISVLILIAIGFILSRSSSEDKLKSAYLISIVSFCFIIELLSIAFKLLS